MDKEEGERVGAGEELAARWKVTTAIVAAA
jgi:hypothetical protein